MAIAPDRAQAPLILTLDLGTSSIRAMLFDARAENLEGLECKAAHQMRTGRDGAVEGDADELFEHMGQAIDGLLERAGEAAGAIVGVATSSLAANLVGVDEEGRAITPLYTYADTRDVRQAAELALRIDGEEARKRTGAPVHSSYWPPLFLWLAETQPELTARVRRWRTLHEYFLFRLCGQARCSYSMASWTGMLTRATSDWDAEWLRILPVQREQLPELGDTRDFVCGLQSEYRERWPALRETPFFLAAGDGAVSNLGCGAVEAGCAALTVGTSGAMRVVVEEEIEAPRGLWLYRVDRRRGLLGGSLSNGGNLFAWMNATLCLPSGEELEKELAEGEPDGHGLTVLPFLAGERSPGYRSEARGAVTGLGLYTRPVEILRAGLEAIAFRLGLIYDLMQREAAGRQRPIQKLIANGAAMLSSPAWMQITADALGHSVVASGEPEAASRGAALLALEALGVIRSAGELPAALGRTYEPDDKHTARYRDARARQEELYGMLLGERE